MRSTRQPPRTDDVPAPIWWRSSPPLSVSTTEPIHPDRDLGRRLAGHLSRQPDPQLPVIQALLADLLAEDQAFLAPVRDLTGRAAFLSLISRIGQGGGQLERDALLQSLEPTYSARVLERLGRFLDGLLDLPETAAAGRPPTPLEPPLPQARPLPPSSVLLGPPSSADSPGSGPPSRGSRLMRRLALLLIFGATAGITAATVLVFRSGLLCGLSSGLPFCGSGPAATEANGTDPTPEQSINAGLQAARELATANDLAGFERALEQLEANLLPLLSAELSPVLLPQRQGLEAIMSTARERLRQEQNDRRRLDLAREARDLALRQGDASTVAAVETAIRELQAISTGSFSETDARTLLRDLEAARVRLIQAAPLPSGPFPSEPGLTPPSPPNPPELPPATGSGTSGREGTSSGQRGEPLF